MDLSQYIKFRRTRYMVHDPTPKQLAFLLLPHKEVFFGGSAGGGKSDALLMAALQYADVPSYSAIIFRETLSELKGAGGLIPRAHEWLAPFLAEKTVRWVGSEHSFYFETTSWDGSRGTPARLEFGYIGKGDVRSKYQGREYQMIGWDELTHHSMEDYKYLFSRLRKCVCPIHRLKDGEPDYRDDCKLCQERKQIPLRVRAASNPGGIGHRWVKERFKIEPDMDPEVAAAQGRLVRYIGKDPSRPFIPSRVEDNPYLDQKGYIEGLNQLDELRRAQLRWGDWAASADARFKRQWFRRYSRIGDHYVLGPQGRTDLGAFPIQSFSKVFFTMDPAASVRVGPLQPTLRPGEEASWTVISLWGLTPNYHLLWLDMERFQEEIPEVINRLVAMVKRHQIARPEYVVVENIGVGMGVAQEAAERGLHIKRIRSNQDKVVKATPAITKARMGRIWLPETAPWLDECENELFVWQGFPKETDDIIDTLSFAAIEVTWPENLAEADEAWGEVDSRPKLDFLDPTDLMGKAMDLWDHVQ